MFTVIHIPAVGVWLYFFTESERQEWLRDAMQWKSQAKNCWLHNELLYWQFNTYNKQTASKQFLYASTALGS